MTSPRTIDDPHNRGDFCDQLKRDQIRDIKCIKCILNRI